jgi:ABC-type branched-subunit amino acid transport system substrate-binding protein
MASGVAGDVIDIAFVVPESGPSGIFGPSCRASARLAVSELNDGAGILGREVRLHPVDGGRSPAHVADEVGSLVDMGVIDAVTGWHTSAVRKRLASRLGGRVPYVYTAVYEGGERTPGVFLTGETPADQILPAMRWMLQELGVRTWVVVGNDYVWPRASALATRTYAREVQAEILDEVFVPLGTEDFSRALYRVERTRAQGVLMFLLGSDAVRFNRAFTHMRMHDRCVRLSPLMDENMLMATGAVNAYDVYSAAGFFETLGTVYGLDFERRYLNVMGGSAPALTSPGESCYEGVTLFAQLAAAARTTDVARMSAVADQVGYEGPRGVVRVRDRHLVQRIYLARANGLEFDVLAEISHRA